VAYGIPERCGEAHQCTASVRGITLGMRGTTQPQFSSPDVADWLRREISIP